MDIISNQLQAKMFKKIEKVLKITTDNTEAQDILNDMWEIMWNASGIDLSSGKKIPKNKGL